MKQIRKEENGKDGKTEEKKMMRKRTKYKRTKVKWERNELRRKEEKLKKTEKDKQKRNETKYLCLTNVQSRTTCSKSKFISNNGPWYYNSEEGIR
jgi:hypothetical protein